MEDKDGRASHGEGEGDGEQVAIIVSPSITHHLNPHPPAPAPAHFPIGQSPAEERAPQSPVFFPFGREDHRSCAMIHSSPYALFPPYHLITSPPPPSPTQSKLCQTPARRKTDGRLRWHVV